MLRRTPLLEAFELRQRREPLTLEEKFRLYDGLFAEALQLGVLPSRNPLDGIEEDIRRVKAFRDL